MLRGAMRHYGRKIITSEAAFDNVCEDGKENRHNCLFCSSDSSHTSSHNSSLFVDHCSQKPGTRQTRNKKQNCLPSESKRGKQQQKRKKKQDASVKQLNSSNSGSSLFHEGSIDMCTPIKVKKKKTVLVEINSQTSTTQTKPVGRQKHSKSNLARGADSSQFTENLPDFDAIEQDDFFISSTPSGPQQCSDNRLGHSVVIFRRSSLDVSDISSFDNSNVIETHNSPGHHRQQNQANVTFRNHKKTTKRQQKKSEDKHSPDSGNLSDNEADGSLLYQLVDTSRLGDADTSSPIVSDTSQSSHESSPVSESLHSCSVQDLSHSFRAMHLRSRDLTQKLLRSSQISTSRSRKLLAFGDGMVASDLSVSPDLPDSPDLFQESSLSLDDHSPPLPQITEEDSCYSEDVYDESEEHESEEHESEEHESEEHESEEHESEEHESEEHESEEHESEEHESEEYESEEHESHRQEREGGSIDSQEEEKNEGSEDNNEEEENGEDDQQKGDSIGEDSEEDLLQGQHNSSKSNVTLYELINSMSFSEKLSSSSLCKDVAVTASERVLALCGQTQPVTFADCIPPKMMSSCVKIGEGVYGEVFRSFSHGEAVALKIIPIEGDQHVNDCPQKKFDEILPEIVIAKELSELASCGINQTSNFCQVNRVSCVKGKFPSKLLEQWDVYSQNKVSENDRPDMFGDNQLFIVFEFVDGGCPLENYKFVNHTEALSALRQVVFALAVAESHLEFEHRDLHIGNVLVRPCQEETISFVLQDREYQFPTAGIKATIIDFTISRLQKDGCAVFCDVSTDEGLFEGKGDFQFDVYRDMRTENGNDWQQFCPHSNILWVNYLCKKLTSVIKFSDTGRNHRNVQRHLRSLVETILDYSSCLHMVEEPQLWQVAD